MKSWKTLSFFSKIRVEDKFDFRFRFLALFQGFICVYESLKIRTTLKLTKSYEFKTKHSGKLNFSDQKNFFDQNS